MNDRSDGCDVDPFRTGGTRVKPIRSDPFSGRLGVVLTHIRVRRVGVLEAWPREDPMEVGVGELGGVATALADTTGAVRRLAKNCAAEPESEALLPDARRPVEEEARGESSRGEGAEEALAKVGMAIQRNDGHAGI